MSLISPIEPAKRKRLLAGFCVCVVVAIIGIGVMASNGWLPRTDPMSGKKTGWFGEELPKNATSVWNPLAPPPPTPTPQLSKEYIHAGSRLVSVVDKNASEIPPADLAVWRPSTGQWLILGVLQYNVWGTNGDDPVQGDYDGDGRTDFSVYRPVQGSTSQWFIKRSSDASEYSFYFGLTGDIPVPADYDGDGKTDTALWRSSDRVWYIIQSSNGTQITPQFGLSTDVPAPADYDGDGRADLGVWRNSEQKFYSQNSSNGQFVNVYFGYSGNTPVCGDYDGDGKANYALKSGANWIIMNSSLSGTTTTPWQLAGDLPVQNDYDGDGRVDIAVWRNQKNAVWYIRKSTDPSTPRIEYWGGLDDIPVPALYRR